MDGVDEDSAVLKAFIRGFCVYWEGVFFLGGGGGGASTVPDCDIVERCSGLFSAGFLFVAHNWLAFLFDFVVPIFFYI